jgi:hypothetical protein
MCKDNTWAPTPVPPPTLRVCNCQHEKDQKPTARNPKATGDHIQCLFKQHVKIDAFNPTGDFVFAQGKPTCVSMEGVADPAKECIFNHTGFPVQQYQGELIKQSYETDWARDEDTKLYCWDFRQPSHPDFNVGISQHLSFFAAAFALVAFFWQ